ncbi:S41 family peptidase [Peptostreptococcaceae bacterium AGR-M142]
MKKKFSFILGILMIFTMSFTSFAEVDYFPKEIKYSQTQFKADLEVLKELLEKNHANLYENVKKEELDDLFERSFNEIDSSTTLKDFNFIVAKIIAKVGDGHTYLTNSSYLSMMIEENMTFLPLKVIHIGDNWYNDGLYEYIPVGAKITKINNMDMNSVIGKLQYSSGSEITDKNALSYKMIELALSNLYPIYIEERTSHDIEFINPVTKEKELVTINNEDIDIKTLNKYSHSNYLNNSFISSTAPLKAQFLKDKNTAILKISTFSPQDPDEFKTYVDKFFEKIEYDGITNVIYDLRGNLGGDLELVNYILSYLHQKEFKSSQYIHVRDLSLYRTDLLTEDSLEFYKSLAQEFASIVQDEESISMYEEENNEEVELFNDNSIMFKQKPIEPSENHIFGGNNYVLVDEASFSCGSIFPQRVQKLDKGFVVGTKTGGNFYETTAGFMLDFQLPNTKTIINIPLAQIVMEDKLIDGIDRNSAVIADYKIELDYNDYLNSKDTQMNYLLNMIK